MPSVKIPRKSTDTDMTPFVDIAFLILSFFIMATKFKPPEPVEIKTPGSVISQKMPESNAVLISIDSSNKVYFTLKSEKEPEKFDDLIKGINEKQNLGLTPAEISNFKKTIMVGVPFSQLKGLLDLDPKEQQKIKLPRTPKSETRTRYPNTNVIIQPHGCEQTGPGRSRAKQGKNIRAGYSQFIINKTIANSRGNPAKIKPVIQAACPFVWAVGGAFDIS